MKQKQPQTIDKLLTRREAAELLTLEPATLAVWACHGRGPAYIKVGRSVRYKMSDVEKFIEAGRVGTRDQELKLELEQVAGC
jgi:excisionase family DNA binding protein